MTDEERSKKTKEDGLEKGVTACNRTACQTPLTIGERFWNKSTRAFYCRYCARRINSGTSTGEILCIPESERDPSME